MPATTITEGITLSTDPLPACGTTRGRGPRQFTVALIALKPGQHLRIKKGSRTPSGVGATIVKAKSLGGSPNLSRYTAENGDIIVYIATPTTPKR